MRETYHRFASVAFALAGLGAALSNADRAVIAVALGLYAAHMIGAELAGLRR